MKNPALTLFEQFPNGRTAAGLLVLRLVAGSGLVLHGWPKMQQPFGWMGEGAPVPGWLQSLAAFSEFGGGLALIVGLLTPFAAFGVLCTMATAIVMVHWADPFVSLAGERSKEPAAWYLTFALVMLMAGPGAYSLDAFFSRKHARGTVGPRKTV
jgi:putative oxidoreductase